MAVELPSGGGHFFVCASNDSHAGSEVWYVGNLSGIIEIPAFGGHFALSDWTLFRGEGSPRSVPDRGTTEMLLGTLFAALLMTRRVI